MNGFPYLLVLVVLPLVGGAVLAGMRTAPVRVAKLTGLAFALAEFAFAVALWVAYRAAMEPGVAAAGRAPFQLTFSVPWIPSFGASFSLGVDGISLVMVALIALLVPIVLGASWEEKLPDGKSIAGFFGMILVLESCLVAVFAATDVFLFYVAFEVMLIPMYFLIGSYGGVRRRAAATKFFLYSLLGGLMMLASVIGIYLASASVRAAGGTFDFGALREAMAGVPLETQMWIFAGFAIAFAIKAPLVPLHTWLPEAGSQAPAGAGALLVGVLDKVGTFGFLRICLPLLPLASAKMAPVILVLAVIGILYAGIAAAGQRDLKRFVTFTSIAHFGFIVMGCFVFTTQAVTGAALYMVNHGLATGLLFLVVGMLIARGGTARVDAYGGVWKVAPLLGGVFLIAALATIALPGTNSFISEFMVLIGSFKTQPVFAIIATVGIIVAAAYMMWVFQQVCTGPVRGVVAESDADPGGETTSDVGAVAVQTKPVTKKFTDLSLREIAVVTPLVVLIIGLGVYPKPVLDVISPTAAQTVQDSGHVISMEAGK